MNGEESLLIGQLAGKHIERAEISSDIVLLAFSDVSTIDIREADGALRVLLWSPGPEGALHCTVFQGEIPYRLRQMGCLEQGERCQTLPGDEVSLTSGGLV